MKMKLYIQLFFLFFVVSIAQAQTEENDLKKNKYRGKIVSILEEIYEVKDEKNEKELIESYYFVCDARGNYVERSYCDAKDICVKTFFVFDDAGKLKEETLGSIKNGFEYKEEYIYDKLGRIKEVYNLDYRGDLNTKKVCEYDKEGNLISEIFYNNENFVAGKRLMKYDEGNYMIELLEYELGKKVPKKTECDYDSNGNMIGKREYYYDSTVQVDTRYKYDSLGREIEILYVRHHDTEIKMKVKYKYNSHGDVAEVLAGDGSDLPEEVTIYEYKYDEEGNWVECREVVDGKLKKITTKTITYQNGVKRRSVVPKN